MFLAVFQNQCCAICFKRLKADEYAAYQVDSQGMPTGAVCCKKCFYQLEPGNKEEHNNTKEEMIYG